MNSYKYLFDKLIKQNINTDNTLSISSEKDSNNNDICNSHDTNYEDKNKTILDINLNTSGFENIKSFPHHLLFRALMLILTL